MRSKDRKSARYLLNSLLILFTIHCSLFTLSSCGGGDEDGRRLGDYIVGTGLRGWGEGDVIIEGNTGGNDDDGDPSWTPDKFTYDQFIFNGDGTYNGMVRSGTSKVLDVDGEVIYEGDYKCDNSTLKLEYVSEGRRQAILAQVLSFTETFLIVKYQNESYHVAVTLTLRKSQ